ncbi:MAG: hypothetical protein HKO91_05020 [Desulfobacterales bacterium]|nr:hypothetical protein [Desulfobacterales bacterium]
MSLYEIIAITAFLLVCLILYLRFSLRNLIKNRTLTSQDYLWKLKNITDKSEYDIFQIAAKEKGWSKDYVEKDFRRYLEDQTLPVYVKQFLEDGKEHINAYRCRGGDFFNKKAFIFFSLFALLIIGGSFIFCLYILPRIYPFDLFIGIAMP